jgi:predicted helicase
VTLSTIEEILDKLYFEATDTRHQGDTFERMMVQFFKTDIVWADRFDDVWLWMDWPGRPPHGDHGIDLVARERVSGDLVAIQCKFYDPATTIYKADINSFLAESGKHPYRGRVIVTTTDHWGPNAEEAIKGQQIPVTRVRFRDLAESSIDWSQFDLATPEVMELKELKRLRKHQEQAIAAVTAGLATHDRGKLVMVCGRGRTFASLRLAERLVPLGGRVLFLVPSIALLSQAPREWSVEAGILGELHGSAIETRFARDLEQVPDWATGISSTTPRTGLDCSFVASRLLSLRTRNAAAYKGIYALILSSGAKDQRRQGPAAPRTSGAKD